MDILQHLPQDLVLNHILYRLDFTSRVRVRAVCRAWRDLSPPPVPDMPWLWLTDFSGSRTAFALLLLNLSPTPTRTHSLLNLSSSTTHRPCRCPASALKAFGTRYQYLMMETSEPLEMELETANQEVQQCRYYTIYNPFTGDTFQLPCTFRDSEGMRHPMKLWIMSTQLSSHPPNCIVAGRDYYSNNLYFCRPGDHEWVKGSDALTHIWDMIFYKGELYSIEGEAVVVYVDIEHAPLRLVLIDFQDVQFTWLCQREMYLVESGGELLLVVKYGRFIVDVPFIVYRLDREKGRLVQIDDLGDRMLFVQEGCSHSRSGPEPTSDSFFTNNCIYFFEYWPQHEKCLLVKFRLNGKELGTSLFEFHSEYGFPDWPLWINTPTYSNSQSL